MKKNTNKHYLDQSLKLQAPTNPECAPAMVQMQRDRDVELPWLSILQSPHRTIAMGAVEGDNNVKNYCNKFERNSYQEYFENGWLQHFGPSFSDEIIETIKRQIDEVIPEEGGEAKPIQESDFMLSHYSGYFLDEASNQRSRTAKKFVNKLCVRHYPSGRIYLLLDDKNQPFAWEYDNQGLLDVDQYKKLWNKIITISQTFQVTDETEDAIKATVVQYKSTLPRMEYISHTPMEIVLEFNRLKALEKLGQEVGAEKLTARVKAEFETWWADEESFEKGKDRYLRFKTIEDDVKLLQRRLAKIAQDEGYFLCLKNEKITYPAGASQPNKDIIAGRLYRVYDANVTWTVRHTRYRTEVSRGRSGKRHVSRTPYTEISHHSKTMPVYRDVEIGKDPIDEKLTELRTKGKKVFVVNETEHGFITDEGERLREVMAACEASEEMRKNTVVVVRNFKSLVTNQPRVLGASFYFHPMPNLFITQFPQLSLREELSYTLQWRNCELGQLLESIPLAPGEERTISVSTSMSTERVESAETILSSDYSATQSSDFTSEFQKEMGQEFNKSSTSALSANASFSFGGFGGGVSGSTTKSSSLKRFSKSMQKVARKAARSVSQKQSAKTSIKVSSTESVTAGKSSTYTVKNINVGRTLNIMLYQINNRFEGGLYLDDIRLVVREGRELIANSGLYDFQVFDLGQIADAIEYFEPKRLPIVVKYASNEDKINYWINLMKRLVSVLESEYNDKYSENNKTKSNFATSSGSMSFLPGPALLGLISSNADIDDTLQKAKKSNDIEEWVKVKPKSIKELQRAFYALEELLQNAETKPTPLVPHSLIVASNGVYADSLIGSQPSTEPYSDMMRDVEISDRRAEVEKKAVLNQSESSRAVALYGTKLSNSITSISDQGDRKLTFQTLRSLYNLSDYKAYVGSVPLEAEIEAHEDSYTCKWAPNQVLSDIEPNDLRSMFYLKNSAGNRLFVNAEEGD